MQRWTEMIVKCTEAELAVKTKATGSGIRCMFQEVDEPSLMQSLGQSELLVSLERERPVKSEIQMTVRE